jgi:hypothetical protein
MSDFNFEYVLRSYYPYIFPDMKLDLSMAYRLFYIGDYLPTVPTYDLVYTNLISEFE